ncbi:hypothetical protein ACIO02_35355 [Streptomyces sp. NPDC087568]|uniref:hypothetical protein n=1 Tax=Streptomyces sp. NPDC087568 TaxID=3365799 RepID=UPI0037F2E359
MSDSIIVRVTLDSYDVVHPSEKQTQVYVQIPEVARATWLLDEHAYHFLKTTPWPNAVDWAQENYVQRGVVSDSVSAAARAAVVGWLGDDANHDAMQAAWELDQARQHPVARKLLARVDRLEKERDEFRDQRNAVFATNERLLAEVLESGQARLRAENETRTVKREARDELAAFRALELGDLDGRVSASCENPHHPTWLRAKDDQRGCPWCESDKAHDDLTGANLSLWEEERAYERLRVALESAKRGRRELRARVAELEAAPTTVFRASHDSIVMGLYTTAAEARKHCETEMRREYDESTKVSLWWREDEDTVDHPEDGEAELFGHVTPRGMGGRTWRTGYVVTPLEVAASYDEGADE